MPMIESRVIAPDFDEETHTYRVDGRVVPSVTGILNAAGIGHSDVSGGGYQIPDDVMEKARERGDDVHYALQLFDQNDLDLEALDDEVADYVIGYRNWCDDVGFVPDLIEQPVYCEEHDYAGTLDRAGWVGHQRVIVDIKTSSVGLKDWHPKQLAAYAYALEGDRWPLRIVLELKRTTQKGYTPHHFSEKSAPWDFKVFLAARTILTDREMSSRR